MSPNQDPQLSENCPFITFIFGMLKPLFYILKRTTFERKVVIIMAYREPEKKRTEMKTIAGLEWYYCVAAQTEVDRVLCL